MTHRCSLEEIDEKLNHVIELLSHDNKMLWKGFGLDILANVVGNAIDGEKR